MNSSKRLFKSNVELKCAATHAKQQFLVVTADLFRNDMSLLYADYCSTISKCTALGMAKYFTISALLLLTGSVEMKSRL